MNNKLKNGFNDPYDYLSRSERRKKGQRSGFTISAKLPVKGGNCND